MERERALRSIAERQYAMVERGQAAAVGVGWEAQRARMESGSWTRVTNRVIRLAGAPPHRFEPLMAAVLDGGPGTIVNRRSAAWVWDLPGFGGGPTQVSREHGRNRRRPPRGQLLPLRYLPSHLTTVVAGIPVVTLPFLLFQLAGTERPERVDRLLNTVVTRSPAVLIRLHDLLPELAEHGRNGIVFMRGWLEQNPPGTRVVASGLEGRFERILRQAGERPVTRQVDVGGHEWIGRVDFVDLELGVLFEVDSIVHHTSRLDAALDAVRDERLLVAGWRAVHRIPEEWIWYEPGRAVAVVREARRRVRQEIPRSGCAGPP
jgi:very-short-patch-repair endonuclease